MAKRLVADERAESECRRERLQMELRLVEAMRLSCGVTRRCDTGSRAACG
jgi:hypothetical protein